MFWDVSFPFHSSYWSKVVGIWSCTVVEEIWITCPDGYETDCEAGCVPLRTQCREEEVPERFPLVNQQIFLGETSKDLQKHLTWRGDLSSRDIMIHPSSCVQKTFWWLPDQWWHFGISISSFSEVCLPSHHKKVSWWDHQSRWKFVSQVDDFPQQIPCGRAPLTRSSKYTLSLIFGLHLCCWSTFLTIEVGQRQVAFFQHLQCLEIHKIPSFRTFPPPPTRWPVVTGGSHLLASTSRWLYRRAAADRRWTFRTRTLCQGVGRWNTKLCGVSAWKITPGVAVLQLKTSF